MADVPIPSWAGRYPLHGKLTPNQRRDFLTKLFGEWAMVGFGMTGRLTLFPKHGITLPKA